MRKGITPIVSVVLLLLVTIALAGGVMVWLTGYVGGFQQDMLIKGTTCLREDAGNVTFRGYIRNTKDSVLTANNIDIAQLSGPSDVTLSPSTVPDSNIEAGQQKVFKVRGTAATVEYGTYTLEFASDNSIERVTFNCP